MNLIVVYELYKVCSIIHLINKCTVVYIKWEFPSSSIGKESACNAGDPGLNAGSEKSPEEGNGNPLQYSCLDNPIDRGAWPATVQGVTRVRHDLATKPPYTK